MTYAVVCLSIHCVKHSAKTDPVYRLFLDQQLVIERVFWPEAPDYYIEEQLTLHCDGTTHRLEIKNVLPDIGDFFIHDVKFHDGDTRQPLTVHHTLNGVGVEFELPKR